MTVLQAPGARGSVLSAYLPKPRTKPAKPARSAAQSQVRERVRFGVWLRSRAGAIKDFFVATAAFGSCDFAAFHWHSWAGWLSVGLSLFLVDHAVDRGVPQEADGQ